MRLINLIGQRFGRLTVIGRAADVLIRGIPKVMWQCACDCGSQKVVFASSLRSGRTQSCGCLQAELKAERMTIHGQSSTNLYKVWCGMKERCSNPEHVSYPWYGGRGISVCAEWENSFSQFAADMGARPSPEYSIDRYPDNNGNYEPSNCRWATFEQQAQNRRTRSRRAA